MAESIEGRLNLGPEPNGQRPRPTPDLGEHTDEHRERSKMPRSVDAVEAIAKRQRQACAYFVKVYRAAVPLAYAPTVRGERARSAGLGDSTGELATDRGLERVRSRLAESARLFEAGEITAAVKVIRAVAIDHRERVDGEIPGPKVRKVRRLTLAEMGSLEREAASRVADEGRTPRDSRHRVRS